jgi:hypothetical protein
MKSQWLTRPSERDSGEFEGLARAMNRNRVRQFEFALLLRLFSKRFPWESSQSRALRVASFAARSKGKRLTDLLRDLRYGIVEPKHRRPSLLVWVYLKKLMPPPLMVAWLNQVMEKQVHARILDPFRKGQPRTKSRRLTRPSPSRLPQQQACR